MCRDVATEGERKQQGHASPLPTSISKPSKVQQFQFQTSRILLFMGVQNFLQCIVQFLDNSFTFFLTAKEN